MIVYWDSSAVLSGLFMDGHSEDATGWIKKEEYHLISSLTWAEVNAVMARMRRERAQADLLIDAALQVLERGPWRRLNLSPQWQLMKALSHRWPLRGADLWHLATALSLKTERPEICLLTYDNRLKAAAVGEGVA